jgi:hypothetical protein
MIALALAVLFALPRGRFLRGEDDWDAEDRTPDARAAAMQRGQFDAEANISAWICGSTSRATAERKAESLLTLRVHSLERAGGLSKTQLETLQLAARNDMACFFRKMDALKQECRGMNVNDQRFQQIWQKVDPLRTQFNAGLLDETSLFHKLLQGMSRRDPSAPYQEEERQRRQFRYRATIEVAVTMFEAGVPLTDVQRQKFLQVLFDELKPPKSIGRRAEYVVFYQASKLEEGKLRPIFDDAQWRALGQVFRNAKGMEQNLKTQGFVP